MTLATLMRVRLTEGGRARFPDIGARDGVVLRMDGWPVIRFRGMECETRLPPEMLEVIA